MSCGEMVLSRGGGGPVSQPGGKQAISPADRLCSDAGAEKPQPRSHGPGRALHHAFTKGEEDTEESELQFLLSALAQVLILEHKHILFSSQNCRLGSNRTLPSPFLNTKAPERSLLEPGVEVQTLCHYFSLGCDCQSSGVKMW